MSYRSGLHAVYTQNWHGLKSDAALYESLAACQRRKAFAVGGQETWRCGYECFEQGGFTFLGSGPDKPLSKRGSQGVSITLSHRASEAWKRAGYEKHVDLGPRLMAVRLEVRCGQRGKQYKCKMGIFLVSSYAPTSGHSAADHEAYEANLAKLLSRAQRGDVIIVCTDANASVGRGDLHLNTGGPQHAGSVGSFGLAHVNRAGRRLRCLLESHQLDSLTTFYRKQHYGTYT